MCGIAGLMTNDQSLPSKDILNLMDESLIHRGPDGNGNFVEKNLGLVHRRLAIIDIVSGSQPLGMQSDCVLVANAEIYNFKEVREEISNYQYLTSSDCEVILPLYLKYGVSFVKYLRGMFALALYDKKKEHLLLARDPFGIKPLYYAYTSKGFIFSSEIKPLISSGLIKEELNIDKRDEFLQLQFSTGRETLIKGIKRVLPGEVIIVNEGKVIKSFRNQALPSNNNKRFNEITAIDTLEKTLRESLSVHLRSDVPVGLFFSGGVDSTSILSLMTSINNKPPLTYTAGFENTGFDEREQASKIANFFGAHNISIEITRDIFFNRLPEIVAAMDDPAADYAIVPSFLLAERASEDLKVVISGEGGDELFAGYGRYRSLLRPKLFGGRAPRLRGVFDGLGILRDNVAGWRDGIIASNIKENVDSRSKLQIAQAVDCADWLPNDLLIKVDRCLMYHSLEGRTPFLDLEVAKEVFNFSDSLKINRGVGKYILKKWLHNKVPISNAFSKKKGFTVPVAEWIFSHGPRLGKLVANQAGIKEFTVSSSVEALFAQSGKRKGFAAWVLLFYALWHQNHLIGKKSEGSVFDVLTSS